MGGNENHSSINLKRCIVTTQFRPLHRVTLRYRPQDRRFPSFKFFFSKFLFTTHLWCVQPNVFWLAHPNSGSIDFYDVTKQPQRRNKIKIISDGWANSELRRARWNSICTCIIIDTRKKGEKEISLVVFFLSKNELVDEGEQSDTPPSCVVLPLKSSSLQMTDHVE